METKQKIKLIILITKKIRFNDYDIIYG